MRLSDNPRYLESGKFIGEGRFNEARECYAKCMEDTKSVWQKALLLCLTAKSFAEQGNVSDARDFFEKAEEIDTTGVSSQSFSKFLYSLGETDLAVQKCFNAIAIVKNNPEAEEGDDNFIEHCRNLISQYQKNKGNIGQE